MALERGLDTHSAVSAVLRPRSAVVIGASARRRGSGNFALANLLAAPGRLDVFVVHPTAAEVDGVRTTPSVDLLPEGLDVALVSIPGPALLPVLNDLDRKGCRAAIVPASGMDAEQLDALARFAASSDMALHGPNCMGLINVTSDVSCWFYEDTLTAQQKGPVSLVSQSGSAVFLSRSLEGVGLSKIISTGNELGLTTGDFLSWLATDDDTTTIGLVIESLRDIPRFVEAVRHVRAAGKRVVALKVGRTEQGTAATLAHTGALAGADAGYVSLFHRLDIPLVSDYDELAVSLQVLATPGMPASRGARLAVVTDSGGEAGLAADLSHRYNLRLPEFTRPTVDRLADVLPGATIGNPLDAGASPGASEDTYLPTYSAVVADENVDALMVIVEGHQSLTHGELHYSTELAAALRDLTELRPGKPVIVVSSSSIATNDELRTWVSPVPLVRGITNAFAALAALTGNQLPVPDSPKRPPGLPDPEQVQGLRGRILERPGVLSPGLASAVLDAYGLPMVATSLVSTAREAANWAEGRYPVALKISSPDLPHRSDVGGVALDLQTTEEVTAAARRIYANVASRAPRAQVDGLEVQSMVPRGVEVLVGFTADQVFGALITRRNRRHAGRARR